MTPTERLNRALLDLAVEGGRPRCAEYGGHEMWTSDDPDDRALAARWCRGCPILPPCHDAAVAEGERWTVRGGVDFRSASKPRPRTREDSA